MEFDSSGCDHIMPKLTNFMFEFGLRLLSSIITPHRQARWPYLSRFHNFHDLNSLWTNSLATAHTTEHPHLSTGRKAFSLPNLPIWKSRFPPFHMKPSDLRVFTVQGGSESAEPPRIGVEIRASLKQRPMMMRVQDSHHFHPLKIFQNWLAANFSSFSIHCIHFCCLNFTSSFYKKEWKVKQNKT